MSRRVLVVDDSKLARIFVLNALRGLRPDWIVVEADSAKTALHTISSHAVDIALVDFNMPGADGLALVAMMRKTHPHMPIAIVSANVQVEIVSRAKQVNAAFIEKPLDRGALAAFLSGAELRLRKRPNAI